MQEQLYGPVLLNQDPLKHITSHCITNFHGGLSKKVTNFKDHHSAATRKTICGGVDRSVVKSGGQGQSGQAIKLFQITPHARQ